MENETQSEKKQSIDLIALFNEYKSKWWWFAISIVLCTGLAVAYSFYKKPTYLVKANVLISQLDQTNSSSVTQMFSMGDMFGGYSSVDDESMVMSSHTVFVNTVKDLQLQDTYFFKESLLKRGERYKNAPIEIFYDRNICDTLGKALTFKLNVDKKGLVDITAMVGKDKVYQKKDQKLPLTVTIGKDRFVFNKTKYFINDKSFKETVRVVGYNAAADALAKNVKIAVTNKNANFIGLSMYTTVPAKAKAILNDIVENYNEVGVHEKKMKGQQTADFIEQRLRSLQDELNNSDRDIESYKKSQNITDVDVEASYQLNRKNALQDQLISAETDFQITELTRNFISNPENKYALIPTMNGTSAAADAIKSYNELILERMKLENNAKSNNMALKVLSEQIDAMRGNILVTLNKSVENARVRLNDIRLQSRESETKLGKVPTQVREFANISRQHQIKENLYIYLLQQKEETILSIANSRPRGLVIDAAYTDTTSSNMGRIKLILLGLVMGFAFPIGILYLLNMLRTKIKNRNELENLTTAPILGEVSYCDTNEGMVVVNSNNRASELFRYIRSNLQFVLGSKDKKVILVTSTSSGEGKSFISINLAASLALLGKKVIIIGTDIRRPKIAEYLVIQPQPGLTQYLTSEGCTIMDVVQDVPSVPNLKAITGGPIPPNPSELLTSEHLGKLIEKLRTQYDYIIIDSAPVGLVSDTFALNNLVDATIFVCRTNFTTYKDLEYFNFIYKEKRLKNASLVVNATDAGKTYGYGYGYGYS